MMMVKTKRIHKYKQSRRTELTDVPPEILINILKRLHLRPLCHLECDSKNWFQTFDCSTKSISLASKTLSNVATEAVAETPLLMRPVRRTIPRINADLPITVTALELLRYDGRSGTIKASEILSMSDEYHYNVHFVFNNLFCFKHIHDDKPCFSQDYSRFKNY
ncbi:hypothetical protein ACLB2K_004940 [Fragaria x ananassa]